MKKLTVSRQVAQKLKQGQSLLEKQDFESLPALDQEVQLLSGDGQSLGVGYLSEQNKGIGWFVSQELVAFDQDFFKSFSSKPSNTVVLIMRMKRRRPFVSLTKMEMVLVASRLTYMVSLLFFLGTIPSYFRSKETILAAFQEAFPEVRGGYEKIRFKGLDYESAHVYGEEAPQEFLILENGVSYQVFLNDGLMTGIFWTSMKSEEV